MFFFFLSQSNSLQNPAFQAYIIQVAENLDPAKDTDASRTRFLFRFKQLNMLKDILSLGFFASLPCLLQSNIIDFARGKCFLF